MEKMQKGINSTAFKRVNEMVCKINRYIHLCLMYIHIYFEPLVSIERTFFKGRSSINISKGLNTIKMFFNPSKLSTF